MSERLHGYLGQTDPVQPVSPWATAWPAVISGAVEAIVSFLLAQWLVGKLSKKRR